MCDRVRWQPTEMSSHGRGGDFERRLTVGEVLLPGIPGAVVVPFLNPASKSWPYPLCVFSLP